VRLGQGVDDTPVYGGEYRPKSRGREVTFQQDLADWAAVRAETAAVARALAREVAEDGRAVARVVVKVRWVPFTTRTRGRTLPEPVTDPGALAGAIEDAALEALDGFAEAGRPVRLVGVRAEFV
jgi:DNA polymerase-4